MSGCLFWEHSPKPQSPQSEPDHVRFRQVRLLICHTQLHQGRAAARLHHCSRVGQQQVSVTAEQVAPGACNIKDADAAGSICQDQGETASVLDVPIKS